MGSLVSHVSLAALILISSAGCRQLLEIEDAALDEQLQAQNDDTQPTDGGANSIHATPVSDGGNEVSLGHGDAGAGPAKDPSERPTPLMDSGAGPPAVVANEPDDAGSPEPVKPVIPDPGPDVCLEYCLEVQENCTGEFEQYQELSICLDVCKLLPEGEPGDKQVNTVQCRLRQATVARLEPFTNCKYAGPIGQGECGGNCEAFCDLMGSVCTEETAGVDRYPTRQACMDDCSTLPDLEDFTTHSSKAMFSGEHVQCRVFHVSAATEEADYHCAHAIGDFPCREE